MTRLTNGPPPLSADPTIRDRVRAACLALIAEGYFPGCSRLARSTRLSEKTAVKVRESLVLMGELTIPGGLKGRSVDDVRLAMDEASRLRAAAARRARAERAESIPSPAAGPDVEPKRPIAGV